MSSPSIKEQSNIHLLTDDFFLDANTIGNVLTGHTNAVWDLAVHNQQNYLLSCSADGSCRIWNPTIKTPLVNTYPATKGMMWGDMVWYGVLWCGMVWYGMVWYGMLQSDVI